MSGQQTQSEVLVEIAQHLYDLHMSTSGDPFALPSGGGIPVARMFRGGSGALRARLSAAFLDAEGRPPSANALADALGALEGLAMRSDRVNLELRVARRDDGAVVIDLGHEAGRFAVVDSDGWKVTDHGGVIFRRTALTSAMPEPERGGSLSDLGQLLNVDDADLPLLYAWAVSALLPDMPHPIVLLTGEQGTGKSAAARVLANLLDPSPAPLRTSPRDLSQWAVGASGSWIVALDNISRMSDWLSDALCRAATGDGMVTRRLYSDADVSVLAFRRCVVLTSIDAGALRGDLAERLLVFELQRLGDRRRTEADLDAFEERVRPGLLGALLDLTSDVLGVLPTVELDELPRMADFGRVVAAVDQVLGTSALDRYMDQSGRIAGDVLDGDPVAVALLDLLDDVGTIEESAGTILDTLDDRRGDGRAPKGWPRSPQAMGGALKRLSPALRTAGIDVEHLGPTGHDRTRLWWLTHEEGTDNSMSATSATSAPADNADDADNLSALPSSPPSSCDHGPDCIAEVEAHGPDGRTWCRAHVPWEASA